MRLPDVETEFLLRELKENGLEGVEALYSEHDTAFRIFMEGVAARLDLAISGGTDFHGAAKPAIRLGTGKGDLRVSPEILTALKARREKMLAASRA